MKEKLKLIKEKIKSIFKHTLIYSIIVFAVISSFFVGIYYNEVTKKEKKYEVTKIIKDEVSLAIDENSNLIIIENKTGDYTIYEDSVGVSIFRLYAKNVWGQHKQ